MITHPAHRTSQRTHPVAPEGMSYNLYPVPCVGWCALCSVLCAVVPCVHAVPCVPPPALCTPCPTWCPVWGALCIRCPLWCPALWGALWGALCQETKKPQQGLAAGVFVIRSVLGCQSYRFMHPHTLFCGCVLCPRFGVQSAFSRKIRKSVRIRLSMVFLNYRLASRTM